MRRRLRVGDRVRVRARCRLAGYRAGDKGVVDAGPITAVNSKMLSYRVHMNKDAAGTTVLFTEGDIEPPG
jgi:hypothetical protein